MTLERAQELVLNTHTHTRTHTPKIKEINLPGDCNVLPGMNNSILDVLKAKIFGSLNLNHSFNFPMFYLRLKESNFKNMYKMHKRYHQTLCQKRMMDLEIL